MTTLHTKLEETAAFLRARLGARVPRIGLILGSGLGRFADTLEDAIAIEYRDIPHFEASTVPGHAGRLVCGTCAGALCVAMQGRLHLYEGHSAATATFPIRSLIHLGARSFVITNAAGGMHPAWEPGTLMLIRDHINFMPDHPLRGPNDERLGPRFPDMTQAYDPALRALAKQAARALGVELQEGVYLASTGPTYETPAEVRMMRTLGADACGMSTVPEVIVARHMGARVLGISCITNKAAGITGEPLSHDEVTEAAARVRSQFQRLIEAILAKLAASEVSDDQITE
ncbi:MAG: purine-nucleoside phosphorylase [Haliangiales bacterium]